jgi:ATP-dependent protease ClpP protease subunit
MRVDPKSCVYLVGTFNDDRSEVLAHNAMAALLKAHKEVRLSTPITLYISSGGGYVELGLAIQSIIEQIRREGRKVIAHVLGYAFSSAFDIVQHCDIRRAEPTAGFMTHEEQYSDTEGSTSKILADVTFGKKMEQAQLELYVKRAGKTVQFYRNKIRGREWNMNAREALEAGFLDEIVETIQFVKPPRRRIRVKKILIEDM